MIHIASVEYPELIPGIPGTQADIIIAEPVDHLSTLVKPAETLIHETDGIDYRPRPDDAHKAYRAGLGAQ